MTLLGLIIVLIVLNALPSLGVPVPAVLLKVLNLILIIFLVILLFDLLGFGSIFNRPLVR